MTPIKVKATPPGYKPSPLQKAKMVEGFKNRVTSMITGGPRSVPRQTVVGTPSGKPMANDSFIQAIAAGPQPGASKLKMGAMGFKKGGKTTTLHSITKSSKKSNW